MSRKSADLKEKIEARKKEAEKKNIHRKASIIARYLGENTVDINNSDREEKQYKFTNENFCIEDSFGAVHGSDGSLGFFGTKITYKDKEVFHQGGGTTYTYIPARWEAEFNRLHTEAEKVLEGQVKKDNKVSKMELREKEEKERKNWGL